MSDEINKIKAIVKLSSALCNIDEIAVSSNLEFSGKLKRDLIRFCDWFVYHTSEECIAMCAAHEEAYLDLIYYWTTGIDDCVEASSETKKHTMLFYCKAYSALQDLKSMDSIMTNKIFMMPIITRLNTILPRVLRKSRIIQSDVAKLSLEVSTVVNSVVLN